MIYLLIKHRWCSHTAELSLWSTKTRTPALTFHQTTWYTDTWISFISRYKLQCRSESLSRMIWIHENNLWEKLCLCAKGRGTYWHGSLRGVRARATPGDGWSRGEGNCTPLTPEKGVTDCSQNSLVCTQPRLFKLPSLIHLLSSSSFDHYYMWPLWKLTAWRCF